MYQSSSFFKDFKKSPHKAFKKLNTYITSLSESDLEVIYSKLNQKLIVEYFKQNIAIEEMTAFLLKRNFEFSLLSIKKQKTFLLEGHFGVLLDSVIDKNTLDIYTFWNNLSKNILKKTNNYDSYLKRIDLETLLVRLTILYEYDRFKNPNLYINNPNKVAVFEKILYKKLLLGNFGIPSNSSDLLFELFRDQLSFFKDNIIDFEILKSLYEHYDLLDKFEYLLDEYSLNGASVNFISINSIQLTHDIDFRHSWQINNSKNIGREHYFNNIVQILSKNLKKDNISQNLLKYNLHNLENEIKVNNVSFPASLYIDLFEYISSQFNTVWNHSTDIIAVLKEGKIDDKEILKFIHDFSMDRTPIDSLSYNHEPNQEKVKKEITILDWASNDFNNPKEILKNKKIDLSLNPLIKFGSQYIALSGVVSNKNIGDILSTKVRLLGNKIEYGINFEKKIAELFTDNEFKTYSEKYIKNENKGEFDLLAYKDGYLFIIETKATKGRLSLQDIENQKRDSLTKLLEQLDKNYIEIKDDFENLKMKLEIKETLEDLVLVPLAVTNNFEFEEELFETTNYLDKIIKISAFELELILNDTASILYDKPNFILWKKDYKTCPSKILYSSIKERIIWKDLIDNVKNEKANITHHKFYDFTILF